ncbi:Sister chromatid cohesion protein 2 [Dipsacomyces acuminosporus]|nr:Sister chromatid cohesion protein 2 [Dipsacomyces acuminosporus]
MPVCSGLDKPTSSASAAARSPSSGKAKTETKDEVLKRVRADPGDSMAITKRSRTDSDSVPVSYDARALVENEQKPLKDMDAARDITGAHESNAVSISARDASSNDSSLQLPVEELDDYLTRVFQEDDLLSDGCEPKLCHFHRIPGAQGANILLDKRTVRHVHDLLAPCTAKQLASFLPEETTSRFVRLLVQTIETANAMDLAGAIKSGALVEDGARLSSEYHQNLDDAVSASCLGLEAAALVIDMVASGKASSSAYNEDSLHAAVSFFKECIQNCAIPLLSLDRESGLAIAVLESGGSLHKRLHTFLGLILSAHSPVTTLVGTSVLAEQDIISVAFASVGAIFCSCELLSGGVDGNLLESVRRAAQRLLRRVFEAHTDQRSWILEEILASLIKLPVQKRSQNSYRLASGKPVQFVTVLLLQLLQGTARSPDDLTAGFESGALSTKEYRILLAKHRKAMDAALSSVDFTVRYLIGRCIRHDNKATSSEAEYRNLLDVFISDCVALLDHPQWPISELVVRVYSLRILDVLDEEKADFSVKSMALESAALIASHIAHTQRVLESSSDDTGVYGLEAVSQSSSLDAIGKFTATTCVLLEYLQSTATGGDESATAIPLYIGNWAAMLISVLLKAGQEKKPPVAGSDGQDDSGSASDEGSTIGRGTDSEGDNGSDSDYGESTSAKGKASIKSSKERPAGIGLERRRAIEGCLKAYMEITHRSTKAVSSNVTQASASEAAKRVLALFPLYRSFDMLLSRVAFALGSSLVTLRSKALRALNQIAAQTPSVLYQPKVKYAINHRLQDSSSQVREAAIDLIGKHIAQNPELTDQYYEFISVRVLDKGTTVRKRVIRILRSIYTLSNNQQQLVDIGVRLLQRTSDSERSVRELAVKALQELWFTTQGDDEAIEDRPDIGLSANLFSSLSPDAQILMTKRVRVMTGVMEAVRSRELSDLMADLFEYVTTKVPKAEVDTALFVIRCLIDGLFEQLLRAEEAEGGGDGDGDGSSSGSFSTAACLRVISTLSSIAPAEVGLHAEVLSTYLKMTSASEEDMLHSVLVILGNVLLKIPHPSAHFLNSLEDSLVALLSSSPQSILAVAIPCLCQVIEKITRNYAKLIRLFRSCVMQLHREQRLMEAGASGVKQPKNVMRFMILAGLMCRHFEFDSYRSRFKDAFKDVEQLFGRRTVLEYMNTMFLYFASPRLSPAIQLAAIQMLGQLYIKRPRLALAVPARAVMDRVFAGNSTAHKLQVVRSFLEFLREDAKLYAQRAKEEKGKLKKVDARALVGKTDGMGEAGVGASLMQTYLDRIIDATFVPNMPLLRAAGFEVVSLVLEQGLAHPLKCVPALIALETDSDPRIRNRSLKLHQDLDAKYASFIHSRDMEGVRKAYEYQASVRGSSKHVVGYSDCAEVRDDAVSDRPIAYLQPLYSILRSKRPRRNEFLASLIKACDYDTTSASTASSAAQQPCIPLARFIAENISALDFKCMEEVLHAMYQISAVIAGTGLNIYQAFESQAEQAKSKGADARALQWKRMTEASVCIAILFVLREFLKLHYSISEARFSSFNPSDTAALREKSVTWHVQNDQGRIDWSQCPYAVQSMETHEAYSDQRIRFKKMIAESLAADDDSSNTSVSSGNRPSLDNDSAGGASDGSFDLQDDDVEFLANVEVLN